MREHLEVSEARLADPADRQTIVLDPQAHQHVEAVWFGSGMGDAPSPRAVRLAGFELQSPRIRVDRVLGAPADNLDEYLRRREALLRFHGGQSTVVVESIGTMYGTFTPHLVCFSAWPGEHAIDSFEADPDVHSLREQLAVVDAASTRGRLHGHIHSSPDPFEMTFGVSSCYELCALWNGTAWSLEKQQEFFEETVPSRTRHGAGPGLVFEPTRGAYLPNLLCLSEWPSLRHFTAFVDDPDHAGVSRKRDAAFARMDATATRVYSPGRSPRPKENGDAGRNR